MIKIDDKVGLWLYATFFFWLFAGIMGNIIIYPLHNLRPMHLIEPFLLLAFMASFYFNKWWLAAILSTGWAWFVAPNDGFYWLVFLLALKPFGLRQNIAAFGLILTAVIARNMYLNFPPNTIMVTLITYLSAFLFALEDKGQLYQFYSNSKERKQFRLWLYLICLATAGSFVIAYLSEVGLAGGFPLLLIPAIITSFYFKNLWLAVAVSVGWIWFIEANTSFFVVAVMLAVHPSSRKQNIIAFAIIMVNVFARNWVVGNLSGQAVNSGMVYATAFLFILQYAKFLRISKQSKRVTIELEKISIRDKDLPKFIEVYVNQSTQKAIVKPKKGNDPFEKEKLYDAKTFRAARDFTLAYNNITEHHLAFCIIHQAYHLVPEYDEERILALGLKQPSSSGLKRGRPRKTKLPKDDRQD
ncbi:MAG: hypothetical protein FWE37_08655 [Spirochaetaceae bacterium]|nr:hypothetical protein [Spirochaetaceae bacterium]